MARSNRGLDLDNLDTPSAEEDRAFGSFYATTLGHRHLGLDYMLNESPNALKLYRRYSDAATPENYEQNRKVFVFGFLPFYALQGYAVGVRYLIHTRQRMGMSKTQIVDGINVSAIVHGPLGMETVARALRDYEWLEPEKPAEFPEGWSADYARLRSGLDFASPGISHEEQLALEDWYQRTLGEIPRHVRFLLIHRPTLLKAYRQRWEEALTVLPIQFIPTTLLHYAALQLHPRGLRENLLLAKAFGVTKEIALQTIGSASLNSGMDAFELADEVAQDVFEEWV